MTTETAVVFTAIVSRFALTLSWAERQTRGVEGRDQKADASVLAPSSSEA